MRGDQDGHSSAGFGREAVHDCILGGYRIPAGATVIMSQWIMHRHPRYFENAEQFDPDRWANGLLQRVSKYVYFPFGGGPRTCIGNTFAMMEASLVLATVAQDDKNAALAMGATRWEMLRACVFPRVRSGLVGAVMLGMGRALGETIAVALVIGSNQKVDSHIFHAGDSMASVIAHEFGEAATTPLYRASLIGLAVLLFVFTLLVNIFARWITGRAARKAAL